MTKYALLAVILLSIFLQTGCATTLMLTDALGTLGGQTADNVFPFCGSLFDGVAFVVLITGVEGVDGILFALGALVDLPFSLAADVITLPYTLIKWIF